MKSQTTATNSKMYRLFIYEIIYKLIKEKSSERKKIKELIAELDLREENLDKNILLIKIDGFSNQNHKREDAVKPSPAIIINSNRYQLKSIIC